MIDFSKRFMAQPVLAWFAIVLLAAIAAVPPTYLLISDKAAWIVSMIGMLIAMHIAIFGVLWDYFFKRRA